MSLQWPKISIVTPSYNQAYFLEKAVLSVLTQEYPNLEYIIIDGGSTDGSVDIIRQYEDQLAYWISEPDAGQYEAINKGFAQSTGEIMGWLNSDDMYFPWALKTVASIMSDCPQIEWLTTFERGTWDWHGFCVRFYRMPGYSRDAFLEGHYLPESEYGGCIQQESTFWKRELWEKTGNQISHEFKLAGDFDLWARFYLHADLYATFTPLGGFRYRAGQGSSQVEQYKTEAKASLEKMRKRLKWSPRKIYSFAAPFKLITRIPYIKAFFPPQFRDYSGMRVVRSKPETPKTYWKVEEYSFL